MVRRTFGPDPGADPKVGSEASAPKVAPKVDRKGGASCLQIIGWCLVAVIASPLVISILSTVSSDRRQWENAIEKIDGVESVEVENEGYGIMVPEHVAEIAVSPDLTEEQALAVVGESCDHDVNMVSVTVSTSWPSSGPPPGVKDPESEVSASQSCLLGARVVQYSHTFDEVSDTSSS